jgi:hypothetical protein
LGNPLHKYALIGTYGELLVILRLLDFGVQACFTLKDSGNDLIAIKESSIKTIQVKSTKQNRGWNLCKLNKRKYDVLALVSLCPKKQGYDLERSRIFLLKNSEVNNRTKISNKDVIEYELSENVIQKIFTN